MTNPKNQKKSSQKLNLIDSLQKTAYERVFGSKTNKDPGLDMYIQAKCFLCFHYKILWNDPKWDLYTLEELLIEYFMVMFVTSPKYKEEYESGSSGNTLSSDDFAEWAKESSKKPVKIEEDFSK